MDRRNRALGGAAHTCEETYARVRMWARTNMRATQVSKQTGKRISEDVSTDTRMRHHPTVIHKQPNTPFKAELNTHNSRRDNFTLEQAKREPPTNTLS